MESFDNGSVLISDPKSGKQFKVNVNCLKPYLTSEPPTPADKVNLHLPEVHDDMIIVTPHLINHRSFTKFHLAEDVELSTLGRHPKIILVFFFFFCILYQCTYIVKEPTYNNKQFGQIPVTCVNTH